MVYRRCHPDVGSWLKTSQQPVGVQSTVVSVMDPGPCGRGVGISVQVVAKGNNPANDCRAVVGLFPECL
ncbi:hypothetical protein DPMN_151714 [Dreissena polymorpha]|uniref:Uncharacterized protein n=1 Tax=Dreissena polymorpha TaxID=45954 RepID=A0A9D4J6R9_DREPO|nr:hypothetical protein DPMN_151714 [Dreissena polymorpha]